MNKQELEEGTTFMPQYDANGLIPCIVTSARTKTVIMFAYMNEQSIKLTRETGEAHYWSRSRQEIWHKGATSGQIQTVKRMYADCDQDCLWIEVTMPLGKDGHEISCHTGREGCFYREMNLETGELTLLSDKPS